MVFALEPFIRINTIRFRKDHKVIDMCKKPPKQLFNNNSFNSWILNLVAYHSGCRKKFVNQIRIFFYFASLQINLTVQKF